MTAARNRAETLQKKSPLKLPKILTYQTPFVSCSRFVDAHLFEEYRTHILEKTAMKPRAATGPQTFQVFETWKVFALPRCLLKLVSPSDERSGFST